MREAAGFLLCVNIHTYTDVCVFYVSFNFLVCENRRREKRNKPGESERVSEREKEQEEEKVTKTLRSIMRVCASMRRGR